MANLADIYSVGDTIHWMTVSGEKSGVITEKRDTLAVVDTGKGIVLVNYQSIIVL